MGVCSSTGAVPVIFDTFNDGNRVADSMRHADKDDRKRWKKPETPETLKAHTAQKARDFRYAMTKWTGFYESIIYVYCDSDEAWGGLHESHHLLRR